MQGQFYETLGWSKAKIPNKNMSDFFKNVPDHNE